MSLGFDEAFRYVMETAEYDGTKLYLEHKSYQCCKMFWDDVIILGFSIWFNVAHGYLLTCWEIKISI